MKTDKALWFFGLAALACLAVSLPATATAMQLFHGSAGGIAAMAVFEIGAVGAELATLAIPQWRKRLLLLTILLLVLTTGGNYALGVDEFREASLLPASTYATIRAAGYGWVLAIVSSAIFPALLFVFLTAFTARYRMLRGGYDTPVHLAALWLTTIGHALNTRLNTADQRVNSLEQDVSSYEQRLKDERQAHEQQVRALRAELSSRPAPVEVETIQVVRTQLTLEQAAQFFGTSVSTIRRRVKQFETAETIEAE